MDEKSEKPGLIIIVALQGEIFQIRDFCCFPDLKNFAAAYAAAYAAAAVTDVRNLFSDVPKIKVPIDFR